MMVTLSCSSHFVDHFTVAKWLALFSFAFVVGIVLVRTKHPQMPMLTAKQKVPLFCLAIFLLSNLLFQKGAIFSVLPWFSGIPVFLYFFHIFESGRDAREDFLWSLRLATALVVLYSVLQFFKLEPFPFIYRGDNASVTTFFGNPNIMAEFLGFALLWEFLTKKLREFPALIIIYCCTLTALILFTGSRSVILGLLLAACWGGFSSLKKRRWIAIAAALSLFLGLMLLLSRDSGKQLSATARIIRWENTLSLSLKAPWGIGAGKFQDSYLNHYHAVARDPEVNEYTFVTQPHNEFLRLLAEQGWGVFLLWIFVFVLSVRGTNVAASDWSILIFSFTIFFFNGSLSQASTLYLFLASLAYFYRSQKTMKLPVSWSLGMSLLCLLTAGVYGKWKYLENNSQDINTLTLGCKFFPEFTQLCFRAAKYEQQEGNGELAVVQLDRILHFSPNHFVALKEKAFVLGELGKTPEACVSIRHYNELFLDSRFREKTEAICAAAAKGM